MSKWNFVKPANPESMKKAAGYYLAVKSICDERGYDAISLKDVDGMKKLLGFPPAPIFMLLADEEGLATIPENDFVVMGSEHHGFSKDEITKVVNSEFLDGLSVAEAKRRKKLEKINKEFEKQLRARGLDPQTGAYVGKQKK